MYKSY